MMFLKQKNSLNYYLNFFESNINDTLNSNSKIADVGCGQGDLLKLVISRFRIKPCHVFGFDNNPTYLNEVSKFTRNNICWDINEKRPLTTKFACVFALDVIEHVSDGEHVLSQFSQMLVKNGILILSTPNWHNWTRCIQGNSWFGYADSSHQRFYTINELKRICQNLSLKVEVVHTVSETGHRFYDWLVSKTLFGGEILLLARKI